MLNKMAVQKEWKFFLRHRGKEGKSAGLSMKGLLTKDVYSHTRALPAVFFFHRFVDELIRFDYIRQIVD